MLGFLFYFGIFFTLIFGIPVYLKLIDGDDFHGDLGEAFMPSLMMSIILGIITMSIVSGFDPEDGMKKYNTKTPIYSMYNDGDMSGTYFLIAGSIDEDHYYTYLKMNKHGNYIKDRIEETYDGEVEIKTYTDTTKYHPQIIRYWEEHWNKGFFTIDYNDRTLLRTVIQIPEGSLKRKIQIR